MYIPRKYAKNYSEVEMQERWSSRLHLLLEEKHLTQASFAKELKEKYNLRVSQKTISNWLSLKRVQGIKKEFKIPDGDTLVCIANYFNTTISYLIGDTSARNAQNQIVADDLNLSDQAIDNLKMFRNGITYPEDKSNPIVYKFEEERNPLNDFFSNYNFLNLVKALSDLKHKKEELRLIKEVSQNNYRKITEGISLENQKSIEDAYDSLSTSSIQIEYSISEELNLKLRKVINGMYTKEEFYDWLSKINMSKNSKFIYHIDTVINETQKLQKLATDLNLTYEKVLEIGKYLNNDINNDLEKIENKQEEINLIEYKIQKNMTLITESIYTNNKQEENFL